MSDSDNVVEESLPQTEELPQDDYEGRMAAFMDEQRADQEQGEEDSSPSATLSEEGETEPDSDESTEVEASAEDASAETEAKSDDESISKAAFLKRVNGLNATKRKLEKEAALKPLTQFEKNTLPFDQLRKRQEACLTRLSLSIRCAPS